MQRAANHDTQNSSTNFGGIFSPLAQYPGASYAKLLSNKIELHSAPISKPKHEKTIVRGNTRYLKDMTKNALPFKSALLLVEMDSNASLDRTALRDAGIKQVRVMTSGLLAAKLLTQSLEAHDVGEGNSFDIVFCHARFEDMSAMQWLELMRSHPAFEKLPIVALVGSSVEEDFLERVNFDALMLRPYSPRILHTKLASLKPFDPEIVKDLASESFDLALLRYESCKTEEGKATFNIEEGMRFVQQKEWDAAIISFNKAMLCQDLKGDVELGLAAAWRGKGDKEKFCYYLHEAGLTFTRAGQWGKARSAYAHMLKIDPKSPSPFVRTAQSYVRAAQYTEAAKTLEAGIYLSLHEDVAGKIARACLYTENPPHTLEKVKKAFVQPALKDIVKQLDNNFKQAVDTHHKALSKSREEQAKLEEKVRTYKLRKAQEEAAVPLLLSAAEEYGDYDDLADYEESGDINTDSILDKIPGKPSLMQDSYVKKGAEDGLLPLMNEEELESNLFSSFPKLNEAATVIKTTWKLMKK